MGVAAIVCLGNRLGAAEMFWEKAGTRTMGVEGLELRLAKRWNEEVSHLTVVKQAKVLGMFRKGKVRKTR